MSYTTAGALRRADQLYYEQISERHTLAHGLAFYSTEFPDAPGDNAYREVWIESADQVAAAWDEVAAFYSQRELRCQRWVPALGQDAALLDECLGERGFNRVTLAAYQLSSWPDSVDHSGLRLLPARAMRRAFRSLYDTPAAADIAERRLDYAQHDMFIAMRGEEAVGRCALFQAGEVAEVRDLFVTPAARRSGVGSALLLESVVMARRLLLRTICISAAEDDPGALAFLTRFGFERSGELVEFRMDASRM